MATTSTLIRFSMGLLLVATATSGSAAVQRSLTLARKWEPFSFQFLAVADIDGDANREIITTSGSGQDVLILRSDESARGYAVIGRIPGLSSWDRVGSLRAIDTTGDGRPELVIQWIGERMVIVDGLSLQITSERRSNVYYDSVDAGDVDGDGVRELIARSGNFLRVLDPITLQVRGSVPVPQATVSYQLRVGDVAGDTRAEVVTAEGFAYSLAFDGQTYTSNQVWASANGPMEHFELADTDGDGKLEAVAARYSGTVGIERFSPAPAYTTLATTGANFGITLDDINGDGQLDALVTCACNGSDLLAVTLQGTELWRLIRSRGTAAIDLSSAGQRSLILSNSLQLEAEPLPGLTGRSWHIRGGNSVQARVAEVYDYLGELRTAILNPATNSFDFWDSRQRDVGGTGDAWMVPAPVGREQAWVFQALALNRPDRPQEALLLVGSFNTDSVNGGTISPRMWLMNRDGGLLRTRTVAANVTPLTAVLRQRAIAPQNQVAIGVRIDNDHVRVMLIDMDTGGVSWQSDALPLDFGSEVPLRALDLDADDNDELVATVGSEVVIYSPELGTAPIRVHTNVGQVTTLKATAVHPAQVLISRSDAQLYVHDGLSAVASYQVPLSYAPSSLGAFRDPQTNEALIGTTGQFSVDVFQLADGARIASANAFGISGYTFEGRDLDGDGRLEIYTSRYGHSVFKLGSAEIIHDNGFE